MKNIVADTGCISPPCLFTFYLLFASSVVWEAFKYNFWNNYLPPPLPHKPQNKDRQTFTPYIYSDGIWISYSSIIKRFE